MTSLRLNRKHQLERRLMLGPSWQDTGAVFCSTTGSHLDPGNVRRFFYRLTQRHGLEGVRIHDLRHTTATILLQEGAHPRVVQEMLGHSNIAIALGTYSHVVPTMHRDAADKLEQALSR